MTTNIDPSVYDNHMGDQFDPNEAWGKPQAENRGTVAWWDEEKGIGMIRRLEDRKEFFVCKDEVKTDPYADEHLDPDDESLYADLAKDDTAGREYRRLVLVKQQKDIDKAMKTLEDKGEDWKDHVKHLYPNMRVWFDAKEDPLGVAAVNVHWELIAV